jgi:hypothetical protein
MGTTAKYLQRSTSGAASIGLGTTIKHLRRTTSGAAGISLCTMIKYPRLPRASAWAPRLSTCAALRASA